MTTYINPIMLTLWATSVQNYFPVIGLAEVQLRNQLVPLAKAQSPTASSPVITQFGQTWPAISSELARFLGVMSDNLDNFAAVKALPPFALFPFFFILPGLLVAGLALAAGRRSGPGGAGEERRS